MATNTGGPPKNNSTATPTSTVNAATVARQRISLTVEPFGQQGSPLVSTLQLFRGSAITRIYAGLSQVKATLQNITRALSQTIIPTTLIGALVEPDGIHASLVPPRRTEG